MPHRTKITPVNQLTYNYLGTFIFIVLASYKLSGVPAYPGLVTYTLPDSSVITIQLRGDENFHYAETEDGYTLLKNQDGYYEYAVRDHNNHLTTSGVRAKNLYQRSPSDWQIVSRMQKNMPFSPSQMGVRKQINMTKQTVRKKSFSTTGNRKLLCILIGFTDRPFTLSKEDFQNLFNQSGYTFDGATGSVRDYYLENSYGQLDLEVDVAGPYVADNSMAYYGGNDASDNDLRPQELAAEAVAKANSHVNYADYDNDGDGQLDGVYIIFAGYGEEAGGPSNAIWSHAWSIYPVVTYDGIQISDYSCSPELRGSSGTRITRIGVICHEFGHVMGAPDFYDIDYSTGGQYHGTGEWDLMAGGSWNNQGASPAHHNPYTKISVYNWAAYTTLTEPTDISMESASSTNSDFYRIDTDTPEEYFLLENRQLSGFDSYLPGHGLIIYHAHADLQYSPYEINTTAPQKFYVVCANAGTNPSSSPASYGEINSGGAPYPGTSAVDSFSSTSLPGMVSWAGTGGSWPITMITENTITGIVSFRLGQGGPAPECQTITTLPWAEDFENKATLPDCFNQEYITGKGVDWAFVTSNENAPAIAASNTRFALLRDRDTDNDRTMLVLPPFNLINYTDVTLTFALYNQSWISDQDELRIYTKISADGEWLLVPGATYNNSLAEWTEIQINLTDTWYPEFYIGFEGTALYGYGVCVDNIRLNGVLAVKTKFWADYTVPLAGEMVTFQDYSKGAPINSYLWNFGPGAIPSTAEGPGPHAVVYNTPGLNSVSLSINGGGAYIKKDYIKVAGPNDVAFPKNFRVNGNQNNVALSWDPLPVFEDDFELYGDYLTNFGYWFHADLDGFSTYGFTEAEFLNEGYQGAFIVFNPGQVYAPEDISFDMQPLSGKKYAACFSSWEGPLNDWLISPSVMVEEGDVLSFYARSVTGLWGLERFRVAISTIGTAVSDFVFVNGDTSYLEAPEVWTRYQFDLSAYAGQAIHFAINCISNDAFAFLVDNFKITHGNPPTLEPIEYTSLAPAAPLMREKPVISTIRKPKAPSTKNSTTENLRIYRNGEFLHEVTNMHNSSYSFEETCGVHKYTLVRKLAFPALSSNHSAAVEWSNTIPAQPEIALSEALPCQGQNGIQYYVLPQAEALYYQWTLPYGAIGNSDTSSILLSFSPDAQSGILSVMAANNCGESAPAYKTITIKDAAFPRIKSKWDDVLICYNTDDSLTRYQWYKDSIAIPGATDQYFQTNKQVGTYYVLSTDIEGCRNTSNSIYISENSTLNIYPVPATGYFDISFGNSYTGEVTISLYNNSGQRIAVSKAAKQTEHFVYRHETGHLPAGPYQVVVTAEGKTIGSQPVTIR